MRSILTALASIILLVPSSRAQLLIYGLSLEKTGRSVNYTFFDKGYLVVDLAASTFSSVIVLTDPNTFNYYQAAGLVTGTYQTMLDYSGYDHAVLFGASSSTDNAALQVIGRIESNRNIGGDQRSNIARKLKGYFLASGAQVSAGNSTTSNGTATSFQYGFAGSSEATAVYDSNLTKQANNQSLDSASALNLIGQILSNRGVPGYTPTPTPTPTPSPTP